MEENKKGIKRTYNIERYNVIHFYRNNLFIGAFLLTEYGDTIEYEEMITQNIFVNIKLPNCNVHFICDRFEILSSVSDSTPILDVSIKKNGEVTW